MTLHPALRIALVFILFFAIVVGLSMTVGYQTTGGLIAPILIVAITWWLYRQQGKSLSVLGLVPTGKNVGWFPLGLVLGIFFYSIGMLLVVLYRGFSISYNPAADFTPILAGILLFLPGVLNEELIFRGFAFQQTQEKYGTTIANIVFALLFLVWHWISWNAWGNIGLMLSAITVCFGHLVFATAFLRSRTLFLPIGIHLGNNWAIKHFAVFQDSAGPVNSEAVFLVTGSAEITTASEVVVVLLSIAWMIVFAAMIWKFPALSRKSE